MSDVAGLIADMVRAGVDPDLVGRAAEAIASAGRDQAPARSSAADRQARYRQRKAQSQGQSVTSDVTLRNSDGEGKENTPTPPKENNPPSPPKGGSSPRHFEEFWDLYPNKVGKADAKRKFDKALKAASFETIMAGLRRYVAKTDDRPWCNPATWLNQQRWEDAPAAAGQSGGADEAQAPDLITLSADHPDFQAVERFRGRAIPVGNSGKATIRKSEIEQARQHQPSERQSA